MPYRHKKRCPKATFLVALRATIDVEPHRATKNAPIRRHHRGRVTAPFDHNAGSRALARGSEHFAELSVVHLLCQGRQRLHPQGRQGTARVIAEHRIEVDHIEPSLLPAVLGVSACPSRGSARRWQVGSPDPRRQCGANVWMRFGHVNATAEHRQQESIRAPTGQGVVNAHARPCPAGSRQGTPSPLLRPALHFPGIEVECVPGDANRDAVRVGGHLAGRQGVSPST